MYRRDQHVNIPTEILRTVATIVDTGSFTRAGERLGLSQPGISAQIKKLEVMVGGPVFERGAHGVSLTQRGKLLLPLAQLLLESNDQILCLGGAAKGPRPIRLSMCDIFADSFLRLLPRDLRRDVHIHCDGPEEIAKGLSEGYFDIGCLLSPPREIGHLAATWEEDLAWVRSRDFVLSPGDPIPVVGWPGHVCDKTAIEALQARGLTYRIAVASSDHASRLSAVASGLAVMALPRRALIASVILANEYYLPALPTIQAGICIRKGFRSEKTERLLHLLTRLGNAPCV